ncbi:MAG: c-type cytochrome [Anaerolineae bacterium]
MAVKLTPIFLLAFILAACAGNGSTVDEPPTPLPQPTELPTPDPVVLGRQVFTRICAECHGQNGEGYATELGAPALDATEHASEHPDQQIHEWIVNGKLGFEREMPAQGDKLTDEEVHVVIAYLQTLWTEEQLAVQQDITARWPATPEPTWTPGP